MGLITEIPVDQLSPMEGQPRQDFNDMDGMMASMASSGQLVPILVANVDGKNLIVDGERRFRAAKAIGIRSLKCIITEEVDAEKLFVIASIANFARLENSPMEIARAFQRMSCSIGIDDVCVRTGKTRQYVEKYLGLLRLREDFQKMLDPSLPAHNRIPLSVAVELSSKSDEEQDEVLKNIASRSFLRVGQAVDMSIEKRRRISVRGRRTKKTAGHAVRSMAMSAKRFAESMKEFSESGIGSAIEDCASSDVRMLIEKLLEVSSLANGIVSSIREE